MINKSNLLILIYKRDTSIKYYSTLRDDIFKDELFSTSSIFSAKKRQKKQYKYKVTKIKKTYYFVLGDKPLNVKTHQEKLYNFFAKEFEGYDQNTEYFIKLQFLIGNQRKKYAPIATKKHFQDLKELNIKYREALKKISYFPHYSKILSSFNMIQTLCSDIDSNYDYSDQKVSSNSDYIAQGQLIFLSLLEKFNFNAKFRYICGCKKIEDVVLSSHHILINDTVESLKLKIQLAIKNDTLTPTS